MWVRTAVSPLRRIYMLLCEEKSGLPFDLDVRLGLECQCGLLGIVACACVRNSWRG
jgi:hypothetical protein